MYPLASGQQRIFLLHELDPSQHAYNVAYRLLLSGDLDVGALTCALSEIIRRHESFRTSFHIEGREIRQRVHAPFAARIEHIDLESVEAEGGGALEALISQRVREPFDLASLPLIRATLVRLRSNEHVLLLVAHHIVSDDASAAILVRELASLYAGSSTGAPSVAELPARYVDYVRWERDQLGARAEALLDYWKRQLKQPFQALEFAGRRIPQATGSQGCEAYAFGLPHQLSADLRGLAQRERVTPFMLWLAASAAVFGRYTGQTDIALATPIPIRPGHFRKLIGFFVNTLPLRIDLSGQPTFRELLARVRATVLEAYTHRELPFERIVEDLPRERRQRSYPLFPVMLEMRQGRLAPIELPGVSIIPSRIRGEGALFELTISVEDLGETFGGTVEYRSDGFDRDQIALLVRHLNALLEAATAAPETPVSRLPLAPAEELSVVPSREESQSHARSNRCIQELIGDTAYEAPDRAAVIDGGRTLSYVELEGRSNHLAQRLRDAGIERGSIVAVFVERSLEAVIALLGVLKTGAVFFPVDKATPRTRILETLADARPAALVVDASVGDAIPAAGIPTVSLDPTGIDSAAAAAPPGPEDRVRREEPAYVMYTSGSTSAPKGVVVPHGALVDRSGELTAVYALRPDDRVLQFASLGFDVSLEEILPTLLAGASVVICADEARRFDELIQLIGSTGITVVNLPVSFWRAWTAELRRTRKRLPNSLRLVIVGSEECLPEDVAAWREVADERIELVNAYGLTETTITATLHRVSPDDAHAAMVPIGRPLASTTIRLLDEELQPVAIGIQGELYVGGDSLALGYLNRAEETARRFIGDPFDPSPGARLFRTGDRARRRTDGSIEFLGRVDEQVKVRGHRVDLRAVEVAMRRHPAVRDAAVVVDGSVDSRLVAFVSPHWPGAVTAAELRSFVGDFLPAYMVPTSIVPIDRLPVSENGKVDKRALPDDIPERETRVYEPPRTPLEETLSGLWSDVLQLRRVGINESFFDLGGHSLLAVTLTFRLSELFQTRFSLRTLFEAPTVARYAEVIEDVRSVDRRSRDSSIVRLSVVEKDAKLPDEIAWTGPPAGSCAGAILLTGATGFLGAYLGRALARTTNAKIHCLVRAAGLFEAEDRIRRTLEMYGLWEPGLGSRLVAVPGDLSEPFLGLGAARFEALASEIDAIYHNGAAVNLIYPYSALRAPNVMATREILRLSISGRLKPVHYVSTTSVHHLAGFTKARTIFEGDPLDALSDVIDEGYAQTKWAAEHLVRTAAQRGIPATVYRPDVIAGDSRTGAWNTKDVASRLIKSWIRLGKVPYKDTLLLHLTPVDYVADAIAHISVKPEAEGRVFHVLNPVPVPWNEVVGWIREYGYQLEPIPYKEWQRELIPIATRGIPDDVLYPLLPLFLENEPDRYEPQRFDTSNASRLLQDSSISCPNPRDLMRLYLARFVETGFLPPP